MLILILYLLDIISYFCTLWFIVISHTLLVVFIQRCTLYPYLLCPLIGGYSVQLQDTLHIFFKHFQFFILYTHLAQFFLFYFLAALCRWKSPESNWVEVQVTVCSEFIDAMWMQYFWLRNIFYCAHTFSVHRIFIAWLSSRVLVYRHAG